MNHDLDRLIQQHDAVESAAYREMFSAAPATLAQSLGLQCEKIGGATLLMAKGLPTPVFNRIIGLGNNHAVSENVIDTIIERYANSGIKDWWLHVSPSTDNAALEELLNKRGFVLSARNAWAIFLRNSDSIMPVQTQAQVETIRPGDETELAETVCTAFEMPLELTPWFVSLSRQPQWQAVCARQDGKIVGGGFLFFKDRYAWCGIGGILPEARGLHIHRALLTLRIKLAIAMGCTQLMTETGEPIGNESSPSYHNIEACGFDRVYSRLNYVIAQ